MLCGQWSKREEFYFTSIININDNLSYMYIIFTGITSGGKHQLQDLTADYLTRIKNIPLEDIECIADPKSTKLGNLIVSISRKEYDPSLKVEGLLYIAASCDTYIHTVKPALDKQKHIIGRGYFTEALIYQGDLLGNNGFNWNDIKDIYKKTLSDVDIKYPSLIFLCTTSAGQSKCHMKVQNTPSFSHAGSLTNEDLDNYNKITHAAYETMCKDSEFIGHTKVVLVDSIDCALYETWENIVKLEIDSMLLQGVTAIVNSDSLQ